MSSPKLKAQLLKGSGTVLTAARVHALVPCEVSATPPASKRGSPAPLRWRGCCGTVGKQRRSGRTNEGVDGIPDSVEVGNLVGEKFDEVESDGSAENDGMSDNGKRRRQMNDTEALQKAERGDGGVEIEAGRKSGAQSEAERLQGVHNS